MDVRVRVGEGVCVGCINPADVIKFVGVMLIAVCLGAVDSACGEEQHVAVAVGRQLPDPNVFVPLLLVNVPVLLLAEKPGNVVLSWVVSRPVERFLFLSLFVSL